MGRGAARRGRARRGAAAGRERSRQEPRGPPARCAGFFILKTLTEVRGSATLTPEVMKQNYCIFGLAGVQFVFAWYLAAT